MQELDEIGGSTVQFADIRNAVNGIHIVGQPAHSPLLGEVSEIAGDNQTRAAAQNIGNILSSDRGSVTLVGSITDRDDIDWYQFDVELEEINQTGVPFYAAFTIDVDYTDGLGRPNTSVYLFNDEGQPDLQQPRFQHSRRSVRTDRFTRASAICRPAAAAAEIPSWGRCNCRKAPTSWPSCRPRSRSTRWPMRRSAASPSIR